MSAGTLTLTNNSAVVAGNGTSFTTELTAADFIVVTVGGIPYTLPVKTVDNATALTLVSNYTGPTQAGAAWYAVPRVAMNLVTAALVAQSAEALRGLNYDKQNWQQIFTGSGTATIKIPDGTSFTGPTWNSLATSLASKADKTALDGKADKTSLGNAAALNVGTTANTVAAGDDARLNSINGKSGGIITGDISLPMRGGSSPFSYGLVLTAIANQEGARMMGSIANFWDGTQRTVVNIDSVGGRPATVFANGGIICQPGIGRDPRLNSYYIDWTGSQPTLYIDNYLVGGISTQAVSDRLLKEEVEYRSENDMGEAVNQVMKWRVASFRYKARGIAPQSDEKLGFIANDLVLVSPECVKGEGLKEGFDENSPEGAFYLDPIAMIAKLALAIQAQQKQILELQSIEKQVSLGS